MNTQQSIIEPLRQHLAALTHAERRAFARRAGIEYATLRQFVIAGTTNPRVDTWWRIARELGVTITMPRRLRVTK